MIQENVSLKPYNTFGIDVTASRFGVFHDANELRALLHLKGKDELLIIGGGSNILLTKNFEGLVLKNEITGIKVVREDQESIWVRAGAGVIWHDFVMYCIDHGYYGIENLSLIPGSVGASPMQNIGAYGKEIKDVFESLEAMRIENCEIREFNKEECAFGYRESVFKRDLKGQYIIINVTYKLSKTPSLSTHYGAIETELNEMGISDPNPRDVSNAVIRIRQSKLPDPKILGNAGSFFKNPVVGQEILHDIQKKYNDVPNYPAGPGKVKLAAGWLIEKAGWKGKQMGTYGVHDRQALVLVNYGGAKGTEIVELSKMIISDIQSKFNVSLEPEVNFI